MARRAIVAFILVFVLGGAFASGAAAAGPPGAIAPVIPAAGIPVADQYIVVLKPGRNLYGAIPSQGYQITQVYGTALNGFAAKLNAVQVQVLRYNPNVDYIEQDQATSVDATQTAPSSWGLDRIDQRALPLSSSYTSNTTASNVTAFVIDTGIQTSHPDFGGRAQVAYDAVGGNGQDCNGHGTHVAGTIGGSTYGVAKGVQLRAVRVLDCNGSGTWSQVIAGMNWVANWAASHPGSPAVANMSLGGGYSSSVNSALANMIGKGVFAAVAAGNSGANACSSSPASVSTAFTVAASDRTDTRASWSNYGSCVTAYAPGVAITSDWLNGGTNTISGTSMATPHVAGIAALYRANNPGASPATVKTWLINNATTNVVKSNPAGTPNRLVFTAGQ